MNTPLTAVVDGRGARRARRGHPWIYSDEVVEAAGEPGDVVRVVDRSGAFCCFAAYSPQSRIPLRRLSWGEPAPDEAFFRAAALGALARRGAAGPCGPGCARLLHADAEGFPGLTIDRYGAHLVAQATTVWADRNAPLVAGALAEAAGAASVLLRNDAASREREGLERGVRQLSGETPQTIEVEEAGLRRLVDPRLGHKTGLYLDQQENHRRAAELLLPRGAEGALALDLFSAEGGFALPLAAAGANVRALDQSEALLTRGEKAAELNGLSDRVEWIQGNGFDYVAAEERAGAKYGAIVLDPPPFARRRQEAAGALRGYKELHRRAFGALAPGGRLLTFSCSFAVSDAEFEEIVRQGAEDAGVEAFVVGRPGPAPDHPESLTFPESRYLKGLLVERRPA
ncbi:MAG: class I SAM-dependent rRNA methyltransferase [Candidatus Polarisedimenticolia bacterium]|nr:class I SAM-dependent rRNA methyltransferase [bacterium]